MTKTQIKVPEQEDIVNTEGKNIIVSASAGSGKTSVMIRKIFKYVIEQGCHIDELLVLTYTKSAALEMKKKLTNKIKENLDKNPYLQEELDLVQTSDISTFDSFCQKLVKKYFYILNIDPSFSILDGSDASYYQDQALDKAIKTLKQDAPEAYENLLNNFSSTRDERTIKAIILEIYGYLTAVYDENNFIEKTYNLYDKNKKIAEKIIKKYYDNIFTEHIFNLERLKQKAKDLDFLPYCENISQVIIFLGQLIREPDLIKMLDLIQDISFTRLTKLKTDDIGLSKEISAEKSSTTKTITAIKEQYVDSETVLKSYEKCENLIKNLINLLFLFKKEYFSIKKELNCYDFDNIERFAIALLEDEKINQEIKNSYKHIFVDEFQDANKVQEKIIFLLQNNNLFFVGDTKQSIYAFRQSDPEIFLNIEKKFKKDENSCSKKLNCNFRTNKNILQFVNEIFSTIMTSGTCGVNYKQDAQFVPKAQYEDVDNEKCVSLNIILNDEQEKQEVPNKVYSVKENSLLSSESNKFNTESLFICQKILSLLGEKIYDNEKEIFRDITYNDIKILVLKRGKFIDNLIKNFNDLNIPYIVNINQYLEECYDNQVLYNLIRLANNFYDDYALYAVLSSALYNFSDSELAYIKMSSPDEKYFYNCVLNFEEECNIKNKLNHFLNDLKTFHYEYTYKGLYYALGNIVYKTNYLLNISYDTDFKERKSNIESYINSFIDSKYNFNVSDYLIYRESAIRQNKVQTDKTFSDAIEITTMHSSKGLEYPVVILPFLNQDYSNNASYSNIEINKDLGIGIKSYDEDERSMSGGIFYNACKIKEKDIETSEKIRLLYVATTRAKNKLILCGTYNKKINKLKTDLQIMKCSNYLSLILGSLPENIIEDINNNIEFETSIYGNEKLKLSAQKVQTDLTSTNIIMPKVQDEENISHIAEFLNKDLSSQKSNIALKNAVSGIVSDENASLNFAPHTLNISEHLSEKANDIGTLYHSLLEKINFFDMHNIQDIQDYIECNYQKQEIEIFKKLSYENIFKNIDILKNNISPQDKVLKEQKFVMCVPYNQVSNSTNTSKVLIQGVMDLIIIKDNKIILIDYKLTHKSKQQIIDTYHKQLELYSLALSKRFKNIQIERLILNLYQGEIINI